MINSYPTVQPEGGEGRRGKRRVEMHGKVENRGRPAGLLKGQCVCDCGGSKVTTG